MRAPAFRPVGALLAACLLTLAGGCGTAPTRNGHAPGSAARPTGALPTGPRAGDVPRSPFYRWDGPLPARPGALLREEPAKAQPEIDAAGTALRILYVSTDARWGSGPIPVSGTVYLPVGTPPAGGWPIAAWAHGTLGVADVCAPSWTGHKPRDAAYVNRWLKAGFAVVATDYQGLGGPGPHAYLLWEAEGRSVLDAVRAALDGRPGLLANDVIVTGQSQGSGAALGTARIAGRYAPDVRLRAVIATGVVSTFPNGPYGPAPAPEGRSPHFTILSLVGGGLRDDAPDVDALVSARARPLLEAARSGCSPQMAAQARALKLGMADAFTVGPEALARLRLPATDMEAVKLPVPLLLGTGSADRTIAPQRQFAAVAALCAAGNAVTWKPYPGVGHDGSPHAAFDDALAFAQAARAGRPRPGNCAQVSAPGASEPGASGPRASASAPRAPASKPGASAPFTPGRADRE
ncbi:MAG TPA: lipase family protein [Quisquiliibacterium sp.]|nr:lipase family protein [Quisquiliibacterium sp.]